MLTRLLEYNVRRGVGSVVPGRDLEELFRASPVRWPAYLKCVAASCEAARLLTTIVAPWR